MISFPISVCAYCLLLLVIVASFAVFIIFGCFIWTVLLHKWNKEQFNETNTLAPTIQIAENDTFCNTILKKTRYTKSYRTALLKISNGFIWALSPVPPVYAQWVVTRTSSFWIYALCIQAGSNALPWSACATWGRKWGRIDLYLPIIMHILMGLYSQEWTIALSWTDQHTIASLGLLHYVYLWFLSKSRISIFLQKYKESPQWADECPYVSTLARPVKEWTWWQVSLNSSLLHDLIWDGSGDTAPPFGWCTGSSGTLVGLPSAPFMAPRQASKKMRWKSLADPIHFNVKILLSSLQTSMCMSSMAWAAPFNVAPPLNPTQKCEWSWCWFHQALSLLWTCQWHSSSPPCSGMLLSCLVTGGDDAVMLYL